MSTNSEIASALETHLSTMNPLPSVAWQNVKFTPNLNSTYLRPFFIPGIPVKLGVSDDGRFLTNSIFQINVITPSGRGAGPALDFVDRLFSHFPVGLELETETDGFKIRVTSRRSELGENDGSFYVVPCLINIETVTD